MIIGCRVNLPIWGEERLQPMLNLIPQTLLEIVEVTDEVTAMSLVQHFGGSEVYFPKFPQQGQAIVQAVGLDAAQKLAQIYGGDRVRIPVCRSLRKVIRDRQIVAASQRGVKTIDLARTFNLSQRRVQEIIAS